MGQLSFIRSWFPPVALLLLTVALARMSERFDGAILLIVIVATALVGASLFTSSLRKIGWPIDLGLALAAIISIARLPQIELYLQVIKSRAIVGPFVWMGAISAAMILLIFAERAARFSTPIFLALLIVQLLMAFSLLSLSSDPHVDVDVIQKLGANALLHGVNPYTITFPDIYGPGANFYPPHLVSDGIVQCGYFYLPLSLLLATPALLVGDVRFANVFSLALAAALIGFSQSGRRPKLVAALVLFLPGAFHVLENAWIEPEIILLVSAIVFVGNRAGARAKLAMFVLFGLMLSIKQYAILAAPLLFLLASNRKEILRGGFVTCATLAIVNLPFFLWDPRAFLHSTVALYSGILRTDSISILAWLTLRFGIRLPMLITACAGLLASICVVIFVRSRRASFPLAMGFVLQIVFLFGTQAFVNYYFLATACVAISLIEFDAAKSAQCAAAVALYSSV